MYVFDLEIWISPWNFEICTCSKILQMKKLLKKPIVLQLVLFQLIRF